MPHSVSHCSGYYSFVEDDPDFQRDIAVFLQPSGRTSPPKNTFASLLLGNDHPKETPIDNAKDGLELTTFSALSNAAAPAIAELKERAKSWDRASKRVLLRGTGPNEGCGSAGAGSVGGGTLIRETRLRALPSRALAIHAIAEESVHGSPIRISSESWSLHNDDEEVEADSDASDASTETGTSCSNSQQDQCAPQVHKKHQLQLQQHKHSRNSSTNQQAGGDEGCYLPGPKRQLQHSRPDVHNWQLCLYVFGGQEASTPGMYRSPMTVWQLFVWNDKWVSQVISMGDWMGECAIECLLLQPMYLQREI